MARIIHVDDVPEWIEFVQRALADHRVDSARTYDEALTLINGTASYDLALIDLNLTDEDDRTGGEILDLLRMEFPATRRVIVTGSPPAGGLRSDVFERYGVEDVIIKGKMTLPGLRVVVTRALRGETDEAPQAINEFEIAMADPAESALSRRSAVDVAIITILPEELRATLRAFNVTERPQMSQPFYETQVPCQSRPERALEVVITSAAKPLNVHVGSPIFSLRDKYSPNAVFLVGIAGGRQGKVRQGDVVIAQRVFYYESARVTSRGEDPRPQWAEPQNEYGNGLFSYDPRETPFRERVQQFISGLPEHHRPTALSADHIPDVHRTCTIATGENVLRDGQLLENLARRFDEKIRAVDQESYGFAVAVRDLEWAIFRGVSDTAGPEQDDSWKYPAAGFAAICLFDFLETCYVPPDVAGRYL